MATIWTFPGGIIPLPTGYQGSANAHSGSVVSPTSWLDCLEGEEIINGVVSTVWDSEPISCVGVSHVISPPLPAGVQIADNIGTGGITVSHFTISLITPVIVNNYILKQSHLPNQAVTDTNQLPPNSILTHHTPITTNYIDYVITVTVQWLHNYDSPTVGTDSKSLILRIWNNWQVEKNDVINIIQGQI